MLPFLMPFMLSATVARAVLLGVPYEILNKRKPEFRVAAEKYYGSARKIVMNPSPRYHSSRTSLPKASLW